MEIRFDENTRMLYNYKHKVPDFARGEARSVKTLRQVIGCDGQYLIPLRLGAKSSNAANLKAKYTPQPAHVHIVTLNPRLVGHLLE
jgi:hypothetical protein